MLSRADERIAELAEVMAKRTIEDLHDQLSDVRHDMLKAISEGFAHMKAEILHSRRAEAGDTKKLKELIAMASAAEQAAIDDIAATVNDIAGKVGTFESVLQGYRDQIQAFVDQDVVDAADKAALQAIVDGMDAEVLGQLAPISQALHAIDDGLQSPVSAKAPLHAN